MNNETKFAFTMLFSGVFIIIFIFGVLGYQSYLDNQIQLAKIQHNCDK